MKILAAGMLAVAIAQQTLLAAGAQSTDYSEIRPRGYSDLDRPEIKRPTKGGPVEMTVNYPEEAQRFVSSMKMMLMKKHHQGSFKHTGADWTLTDETTKKTWIIKTRHTTGKKKSDITGLEAAAELYPKNGSLCAMISRVAEAEKNWPAALAYYRKAFDPGPPDTSIESLVSGTKATTEQSQIAANCAYFELMMGHYATAVKLLGKAIELEPLYPVNYKNRAEAYRKLHKLDLAAQDEKKLKELQSTNKAEASTITATESRGLAADFMLALGSYDEALSTSAELLRKSPKDGTAHLMHARTLVKLGKYQEALVDYKALMGLTKNAPAVKTEMSAAERLVKQGPPPYGDLSLLQETPSSRLRQYMVIKNGKKTRTPIAKIAADHKGDYRVYSAICAALKNQKMSKPLDVELDKILLIAPDDSNAVGNKIETTEAMLKWPEAEKWCTRYMNLLANGSMSGFKIKFLEYVYTVRALARRAQNNCPGAINDETTALKLAPDSAEAFQDRGDCYMQCGKYDLAAADYTKSIENDDSKNGGTYLRRAKAYEKLKKTDLARQDRDTAAKLQKSTAAPAEQVAPD